MLLGQEPVLACAPVVVRLQQRLHLPPPPLVLALVQAPHVLPHPQAAQQHEWRRVFSPPFGEQQVQRAAVMVMMVTRLPLLPLQLLLAEEPQLRLPVPAVVVPALVALVALACECRGHTRHVMLLYLAVLLVAVQVAVLASWRLQQSLAHVSPRLQLRLRQLCSSLALPRACRCSKTAAIAPPSASVSVLQARLAASPATASVAAARWASPSAWARRAAGAGTRTSAAATWWRVCGRTLPSASLSPLTCSEA